MWKNNHRSVESRKTARRSSDSVLQTRWSRVWEVGRVAIMVESLSRAPRADTAETAIKRIKTHVMPAATLALKSPTHRNGIRPYPVNPLPAGIEIKR